MSRDSLPDDPATVVRDARALAIYIKERDLRVISVGVRPSVEVTFFFHGNCTEQFLNFYKPLKEPTFSSFWIADSVWLRAKGGFRGPTVEASIIAASYEARLLRQMLPDLNTASEQQKVPTTLESVVAVLNKMNEHADDCDLTCQQYGQVPCYADRAL